MQIENYIGKEEYMGCTLYIVKDKYPTNPKFEILKSELYTQEQYEKLRKNGYFKGRNLHKEKYQGYMMVLDLDKINIDDKEEVINDDKYNLDCYLNDECYQMIVVDEEGEVMFKMYDIFGMKDTVKKFNIAKRSIKFILDEKKK